MQLNTRGTTVRDLVPLILMLAHRDPGYYAIVVEFNKQLPELKAAIGEAAFALNIDVKFNALLSRVAVGESTVYLYGLDHLLDAIGSRVNKTILVPDIIDFRYEDVYRTIVPTLMEGYIMVLYET